MFFLCQVIPKNFKRANFKLEFNLMICGFTKNSHIKGGGGGVEGSRKTNNILPKRKEPGQFSDLRGKLVKKGRGGGAFEGRGVMPNAHYK